MRNRLQEIATTADLQESFGGDFATVKIFAGFVAVKNCWEALPVNNNRPPMKRRRTALWQYSEGVLAGIDLPLPDGRLRPHQRAGSVFSGKSIPSNCVLQCAAKLKTRFRPGAPWRPSRKFWICLEIVVPGGGIEPPTRGFSDLVPSYSLQNMRCFTMLFYNKVIDMSQHRYSSNTSSAPDILEPMKSLRCAESNIDRYHDQVSAYPRKGANNLLGWRALWVWHSRISRRH